MRKLTPMPSTGVCRNGFIVRNTISLLLFIILATSTAFAQCNAISGTINGNVYQETVINGIIDNSENGVGGILVLCYDSNNTLISQVTTNSQGAYSLSGLTDGQSYRIEFQNLGSNLDAYLLASSATSVQMVQAPQCNINFGILDASADCGLNPEILLTCFVQDNYGTYGQGATIIGLEHDFSSSSQVKAYANKNETGAIWGLDFSDTQNLIYSSAFVKQYSALTPTGLGAIFQTSVGNNPTTSVFADLATLGVNVGTLTVTDVNDCAYGEQVGKKGLGGLAVSDDGQYVYVVNVNQNTLVKVPTTNANPSNTIEYAIPDPGCSDGDSRAFALNSYDGKFYVGVTCTAESSLNSANSSVHVYEFNPGSTTFSLIFSTPYSKGHWYDSPSNSFNTMHWLTDIDFTDDGNMLLSLSDRVGHRYCSANSRLDHQFPDLLMVWDNNGTWTLENNGTAGSLTGTGVGNTQGPGGGEFFGHDFWPSGPSYHPETALGSVYVLPGTNQVISATYDPHFNSYSGGLHRYNTTNGSKVDFIELYTSDYQLNFGKATGFGDITSICPPQEIEIGNFVWQDLNANGIQDSNEAPIAGLGLDLYDDSCNKIGSTVTDSNGNYVFNFTNVDSDNDGVVDGLNFGEDYYIVIDDTNYDITTMYYSLNGVDHMICSSGQRVAPASNENDSDAGPLSNSCPAISGQNGIHVLPNLVPGGNHSFDIGLCRVEDLVFDLALYKQLASSPTVKIGDYTTFTITVMNQGELPASTVDIADHIPTGFDFVASLNPQWTYSNGIAMTQIQNINPGDLVNVSITLLVNGNSEEFVNYAEIAGAYDSAGAPLDDIDSTPDMDITNDAGGQVDSNTDDEIDDDGSKDEDDHDPAMVYVFDLALRKTIVNPSNFYLPGDIVEFKISVFNQGNLDATNVQVVDYLPSGITFDSNLNPNWTISSTGVITYNVAADVPAGASISIPFFMELAAGVNTGSLVNEAEISASDAVGYAGALDYDSTPDSNSNNDAGGVVNGPSDNLTSDHGSVDEDDHDPASLEIKIYDLALIKETAQLGVVAGDTITYTITVFNQGTVVANNIGITDYIPQFLQLIDPNWTLVTSSNGDMAEMYLNLPNGLAPNTSHQVDIVFVVDLNAPASGIINKAEIFYSEDMNGVDFSSSDIDSTPDQIQGNDIGGIPFSAQSDNIVNAPNNIDEDDEDPEAVIVIESAIETPCICLNNATSTTVGQFRDVIIVTGPSNQIWHIQNVIGLTDYTTLTNTIPINTTGPTGFVLEEVTSLGNNMSIYYMAGVHLDGAGYTIQLTNSEGNFQTITNPGCTYNTPLIEGPVSVCENTIVDYSTAPVSGVTYSWVLNGTTMGTGENISIDFSGLTGTQVLTLVPTGSGCQDPSTLAIEIGMTNGVMSCVGSLNVSLGPDCNATITAGMLMTNTPTVGAAYGVMITDANGNVLPGNVVDGSYKGQDLMVKVIDGCSGNSCWSTITIEDKMAPEIFCENIEITCNDMLHYPGPLASDNCDGDVEVVLTSEIVTALDCNPNYIKEIQREYRAEDSCGNQSEHCMQTILVKRISLDHIDTDGDGDLESPVTFPGNFSMLNGNPLTCGSYAVDKNGFPSPSLTGIPTLDGEDLFPIAHFYCNLSSGYVDEVVSDNACLTKILRTWTVAEWWCNGGAMDTYTQLIEVVDNELPTLTCPANITVSTSGLTCSAQVPLPVPTATDVCSPNDIRITMAYADGFQDNFAGGTISLAAGNHTITYAAYDACGNSSTCEIMVDVIDETPPIAICDQNTTVGLNLSGQATIYAAVFDDGSYDECHLDKMEVLRMDAPACGSSEVFSEFATFCCADVGNIVQVMFKVTDLAGNSNTCMVNVEVQDKFAPVISCPANMTIDCGTTYDLSDAAAMNAQFGEATATDVCEVSITTTATENIDQCGSGTIRRVFRASDANGFSTCVQLITISNPNPFLGTDITWPADYSTNATCMGEDFEPENLPFANGFPQISEDLCDLVGVTHEDQTFLVEPDNNSCFKIVRRWSVIDWCQYDGANVGIWHWDQTIVVSNVVAPTIDDGCEDISICTYDPSCSEGFVELILTASDDCTPDNMLRYTYQIDLNNDGSVDIMNSGVGHMIDLSNEYPLGMHSLVWQVEDRCGNTVVCTKNFSIINCKPPTAYCINGVSISLEPMDLDGDGIVDAEMAELCVENVDNGSYHSCGYPVTLSFGPDVTQDCILFDCSDLGLNTIELWVTDINGSTSFCETTVDVQDNNDVNLCDKFDLALINVLSSYDAANQEAVFNISVCNQGNNPVTGLEVTAYIPAGYTLNDPAWTLQADGSAVMTSSIANGGLSGGGLSSGNCHVKQINLNVIDGLPLDDYILYAEITDGINTVGQTAADDCDSTPGSNTPDENGVNPGDADDDNLDGGGPDENEDEDDHDPAQIPLYDLALIKTTTTAGPYSLGSVVSFNIQVENQGNSTVSSIDVVDYVPCGLIFNTANNLGWTYNSATNIAQSTITGNLVPGGVANLTINLSIGDIDPNCSGETYTNFSEISSFTSISGNTVPDIDSDPDSNIGNDGNASNDVTDNSNGDEDDHDPEEVCPIIALPSTTEYCSDQQDIMFASPQGGTWSGQGITNSQTGAFDASLVTGGSTTITYTLTAGTCEASMLITVIDPPVVNLTTPDPVCMANDSNMPTTIDFTVLSSTSLGTWSDTDGTGVNLSNLSSVDFANVSPGMYTFSFTTNSAVAPCSDVTESIEVSVIDCSCPGFPLDITSSLGGEICTGEFTVLTAVTTISNPSYTWSNGQTTAIIVVAPSVTSDYFVTVVDQDNAPCSETRMITITVNPLPICSVSSNSPVCEGDVLNLSENGGQANTWSWTGPNGFTSNVQNPSINNVTTSQAGVYTVTITDTNGCESSCSTTVEVVEPPVLVLSTPPAVCNDNDSGMPTTINFVALSNTNQGTWADTDGSGVDLSDLTNVDFANVPIGTYTFTFTTNNAVFPCENISDSIEVIVTDCNCPGFVVSLFSSNGEEICEGESTDITATTSISNPGYSWSTGESTATITVSPTTTTTYTVTVTDLDDLPCEVIALIQIVVNPLPTCLATFNNPMCPGDDIVLNETGGNAISWSWTGPNGFTSTLQSPVITNTDVSDEGTYTVVITDNEGCTSSCSVEVVFNDTTAPVLINCPDDITINCDEVPDDLNDLGVASGIDNCDGNLPAQQLTTMNINSCSTGTIIRTFIVTDNSGNSAECTQVITVNNVGEALMVTDITFEPDTIFTESCNNLDPDFIGGAPVINGGNTACFNISVDFEDEPVLSFPACQDTTTRTWTVVDSCQLNGDGMTGIFNFDQVIIVSDTTAPVLTVIDSFFLDCAPADSIFVNVVATVTDGCSATVTNDSPVGNGMEDASGFYQSGITTVTFTATDLCGNVTVETSVIEIIPDTLAPVMKCQKPPFEITDDLTVEINIYTSTIIESLSDDCSDSVDIVCFYVDSLEATTGNPADTLVILDCNDVGVDIPLYMLCMDEAGNTATCLSTITVIDPNGFCNLLNANVTGIVSTDENMGVADAEVRMIDTQTSMEYTSIDGAYAFENMPLGGDYEIQPYKNDDPLNGVTTLDLLLIQKHLLGLKDLEDAYDHIAADIDKSGNISTVDLIHLRKLIIGVYEEFPDNTSWRMVDAGYVFPSNVDPLDLDFPESYNINGLNNHMNIDFVGVKIGDVNGSVNPSTNEPGATIRDDQKLIFNYEDRKVLKGETVQLNLSSSSNMKVDGFQMFVNHEGLNLEKVLSLNQEMDQQYVGKVNASQTNVSWNKVDAESWLVNDFITFEFTAMYDLKLSDVISLEQNNQSNELYAAESLEVIEMEIRSFSADRFAITQNEPNPWSNTTSIEIEIKESATGELMVFDMLGKLVIRKELDLLRGTNTVTLDDSELVKSGLYLYSVRIGKDQITKQMIKI